MTEQYPLTEILNEDERIFTAYGSVDITDNQGERIPIQEFKPIMPIIFKRGADIMNSHSNKKVGKWVNYEFTEKNDKPAILLTGIIGKDYKLEDETWEKIKTGKYQGVSFGGASLKQDLGFYKGKPELILRDLEGYEFSVVEKPANPEAVFESINYIAKSDLEIKKPFAGYTDFDDCVSKNKNKGNPKAYCATIMRQVEGEKMNKFDDAYYSFDKNDRPPKNWWDKCIERAESWASDPAKVCGALWHDPGRWAHGSGPAMQESYGKSMEVKNMEEKKQEEKPEVYQQILSLLQEILAKVSAKPEEEVKAQEEKEPEEEKEEKETAKQAPEKVTLPKTVDEEITSKKVPEEKDEVKITEKQLKEIKKSLMEEIKKELGTATTPRPDAGLPEKEESNDLMQIFKSEKVPSWAQLNTKVREQRRKVFEQGIANAMGGAF
ncbi:MAG: HK97 family phage prohead protease [Candidatus Diapherotrites archaeon]